MATMIPSIKLTGSIVDLLAISTENVALSVDVPKSGPGPAIVIREAGPADLPAILALYAQPALDNGVVLPPEEAREIHAQFVRYPHYKLYVALQDGRIVGSYAFLMMHNLGHLGAPSAIVEDVVVDPVTQGRGIGQAMMQHAVEEARALGCYKLMLSSNAKRDRAHALYEQLGFERHGYSFRINIDVGDHDGQR
jgi:GNAT superfamily N-acetyltransferase